MKTLKEVIAEASQNQTAIGQFNISTLDGFWAVVRAAQTTGQPVIIGLSDGEMKFFGGRQARALVDGARAELALDIFLNADHVRSLDSAKEALDIGFDSITFDGSKLSLEDNIKLTREFVTLAKAKQSPIIVEGELGFIGLSSGLLAAMPAGASLGQNLTTAEEAARFVRETGVDLFAPAIGNIHGLVATGEPRLDAARAGEIAVATGAPLVLHGGSGIATEDLKAVIKTGVRIIHVNTDLRVAWRAGLEKSLTEQPQEIAPYKLLAESMAKMQKVVEEKIKSFG